MLDMKSREKETLKYWKEHGIEQKVREMNKGRKKFYFLDGPPYVTGDLHPAHIWVKTLKDIFVRYKRYSGFDVVDRAGYDVHGLPIENKVEKGLNLASKKEIENEVGIDKFVEECRGFVERYIGRMDSDYERYGISLDFKNPYLPYTNGYMETAWAIFKSISDKGFLYQGTKTLIYCPHCETPLSQGSMEVEYRDEEDPSIYVEFKVDLQKSRKAKISLPNDTYLLVWTTTPWTLPSNVAIAVNPKELYVVMRSGKKHYIIAKDRFDIFVQEANISAVLNAEFYGSELEGIYYINPLETKVEKQKELRPYHRVILSESLVSKGEGTGLVHMAPGNGIDDYKVGLERNLPIFSPINPDTTYNKEAGAYVGIKVPLEANRIVLKDLKEMGAIVYDTKITHSYPHCWRCSSKLIFLATEQWFLNVKKIKRKLISANEKVVWHPDQVREWQRAILENSPDWCISRQRYWGIPMPLWKCRNCGEITVIGSLSELKHMAKDRDAVSGLGDLHRPYIDKIVLVCPKCKGEQHRIKDIFDVWFDSGIAFRASLTAEQFGSFLPTALVVEYIEQIRGWFQSMLKVGIMAYGKSPLKHVAVHGIMFGVDGRKMSKSFGNYRPLAELADFASADAFRLWSISHDPILNRDLNEAEIKDNEQPMDILYNISNLLEEYESVMKYKPKAGNKISAKGLDRIDIWILSKLETLVQEVTEGLGNYDACRPSIALKEFIVEDFSRFYLKFAKKRMGEKPAAKRTISIINYILFRLLLISSPMIPFSAEAIYLDRYKRQDSIFMEKWPKANMALIDKETERQVDVAREAITAILNNREKKNIKLRSPILSATIETNNDEVLLTIQRLSSLIESYTNAKEIKAMKGSSSRKDIVPIFQKLGPAFKENAAIIAEELRNQNASAMEKEIEKGGYFSLHTNRGTFDIRPEHFAILEKPMSEDYTQFKYGIAKIDATQTEELKEELFERELIRRIQLMRKEMGLTMADSITVYLKVDRIIEPLVRKSKGAIKQSIRAKEITINKEIPKEAFKKDWKIFGGETEIGISKA